MLDEDIPQMRFQTVIRPRFYRDTDTLALSLLGIFDCFINVLPCMSTQSVVQPRDEFVSVVFRHGHERSSHDTVSCIISVGERYQSKEDVHDLDLVDAVSQRLQLIDSSSSLLKWIVSRTNRSHGCWLNESTLAYLACNCFSSTYLIPSV